MPLKHTTDEEVSIHSAILNSVLESYSLHRAFRRII